MASRSAILRSADLVCQAGDESLGSAQGGVVCTCVSFRFGCGAFGSFRDTYCDCACPLSRGQEAERHANMIQTTRQGSNTSKHKPKQRHKLSQNIRFEQSPPSTLTSLRPLQQIPPHPRDFDSKFPSASSTSFALRAFSTCLCVKLQSRELKQRFR